MTQLRGKELSDLYPDLKSPRQIEAERKTRKLIRKPRFVAQKISAYSTTILAVILSSYHLLYSLLTNSLSSTGAVLSGVSFSILAVMFAFAVVYYFYSLIKDIAYRAFDSSAVVFFGLSVVTLISAATLMLLAQYQAYSWIGVSIVLVFNLAASYVMLVRMMRST